MIAKLNDSFTKELKQLENVFKVWSREGQRKTVTAHRKVGQRWRTEAVKRVPVDEGRLKQSIVTNTFQQSQTITTETGTNVRGYPVYLEFGTERIAGGRVKALGDDPEITDAQAIKNWPAKDKDAISGNKEQMPWLRPAWMKIKSWAIALLDKAMEPPKQKRVG